MQISTMLAAIAALAASSVLAAPVESLEIRANDAKDTAQAPNAKQFDPADWYCQQYPYTQYCINYFNGGGRRYNWRQYTQTYYFNGRPWTYDWRNGQWTPTILDGQFDPDACTPGLLCNNGRGGQAKAQKE